MNDKNEKTGNSHEATASPPKSIWDNDLPPGDSPPMPRWPLTLSIVAYACWMLFLISMVVVRLKAS